jgi:hypothetical protein
VNEILTAKEIAAELRCSKAQVYKLINGEVPGVQRLPAIPLGKKKKVVMRSSFEAWKRTIEIARINGRIASRLRSKRRRRCGLKEGSHAKAVSKWLCKEIQGWSLLDCPVAGER